MKIEYTENFGSKPILLSDDASLEDALELFRRMSWEFLSLIDITLRPGESLGISGSQAEGMSIRVMKRGDEFLSKHPPTHNEIEQAIKTYVSSDGEQLPDIDYIDSDTPIVRAPSGRLVALWHSGCLTMLIVSGAIVLFWMFHK